MQYTIDVYNVDNMDQIKGLETPRFIPFRQADGRFHVQWPKLNREMTVRVLGQLEKTKAEVVITNSHGKQSCSIKNHVKEFEREFPFYVMSMF